MIVHIFLELLGWPYGIILGNLLASVIWASLFEWRLRIHHDKLHEKLDRIERKLNERHSS
jgi:uncharacterized membrane protein YciS (DUF1049 family)